MTQLSGRNSLRDIVENMSAQAHHLYHIGSSTYLALICRASMKKNLIHCTKRCLVSCWLVATGSHPSTISVLNIHWTHWMLLPLKSNAQHRVVSRRSALKVKGLTCDQTIEFSGVQTAKKYPSQFRQIAIEMRRLANTMFF